MKLFILFLFFGINVIITNASYLTHFVENGCILGNETLFYTLSSEVSSLILNAVQNAPYSPNKNCTIILQPPLKHGIVLSVRKIDFIVHSTGSGDYLQVYHSALPDPVVLQKFKFDLYEKRSYHSYGPMALLYHTEPRISDIYMDIGFEVIATAFTLDSNACKNDFRCDNKRCIKHILTCDGHNNCGDLSDESRLTCNKFPVVPDLADSYIVMISICVLLFLFALSCTVFCCVKNRTSYTSADTPFHESEVSANTRPYEAVHPSGYYVNQNPDGSSIFNRVPYNPSIIQNDGGFSNPCYAIEVLRQPPPPYRP